MYGSRPVVVGTGALSPAGLGSRALWRAVFSGTVKTGPVDRFDVSGYPTRHGAQVGADVLARLDGLVPAHPSLAARYLAAAALEALWQAGVEPLRPAARVGVFVGTVMGVRPVLDRGITPGRVRVPAGCWSEPGRLLDVLREVAAVDGPAVLAGTGCCAGNTAIALGAAAIAAGEVDLAICGGADELSHEVYAMFTALRGLAPDVLRPFDTDRRGTLLGEGAGVLVLEHPDRAAARGAYPLATVAAHATRADAYHITAPRPDGAAVAASIRECLRRSGLRPADIGWVCAHGAGTRAGDAAEAAGIAAALGGGRTGGPDEDTSATTATPGDETSSDAADRGNTGTSDSAEESSTTGPGGTRTVAQAGPVQLPDRGGASEADTLGCGPGAGRRPAVSSVKGVLGHAEGAAAALEAVVTVLALERQFVPGNATLRRPDPRCAGLDLVPAGGRWGVLDAVLSTALGFGGAVSTVLLTRTARRPR